MLSVSVLGPAQASAYESLAFPRHRASLAGLGTSGKTVAVGAEVMGRPWGLAVAEVSLPNLAFLYSVVVIERARRRGLATELLARLEAALRARGVERIEAAYRTDRPHSEATSRLLARRGFDQRADRPVVELQFRVARLLEAPALNIPSPGAEVIDYSPERLEPLKQLGESSPFGPGNLPPGGNDPTLARLATLRGEVAACALGFRLDAETGHLALVFVHPDLRRRGLAGFAIRSFMLRLAQQGLDKVSYDVGLNNSESLPFVDGKLAPFAFSRAIVQFAHKSL